MNRDYYSMLRIINDNSTRYYYLKYMIHYYPYDLDCDLKVYLNGLVLRLQL
jgi:hypothetical protein